MADILNWEITETKQLSIYSHVIIYIRYLIISLAIQNILTSLDPVFWAFCSQRIDIF